MNLFSNWQKDIGNGCADEPRILNTCSKVLEMSLEPACSRKLRIDTKKLKDLQKLCGDGIIPKAYHTFYKDLASCHESPTDLTSGSEFEDEDEC
ncbi:hypothetical protein ElyMa_002897200 [Elysia marginata]|uniref:Uncharacterized protein n=1 Tax=Elysia marginata TaxID=1093978 RepID=A0AAV4I2K5_9GAST|nr:hypothetical protein ElyMa_002897200 [Elysia marginata]